MARVTKGKARKRAPAKKVRRARVVEEEWEEFELTATTKGGTPSARRRRWA